MDNFLTSTEKQWTSQDVTFIVQKLRRHYADALRDSGFDDDKVTEVEQRVILYQIQDVLNVGS